jgi:hypothetical protein
VNRPRIDALIEEGWEIFERFDLTVRQRSFHPFIASDYHRVLETLAELHQPGLRFLEWGSASGVITIIADLLGYEAYGIELDAGLVDTARELARKYESGARFTVGSFVPAGYRWKPANGDGRFGTVGDGTSAYPTLGHPLEDFDIVFAYPWGGEEPMMLNLLQTFGSKSARLLLHGNDGVTVYPPRG